MKGNEDGKRLTSIVASVECSALSWKSGRGQKLSAEKNVFVSRMHVACQRLHNVNGTEVFAGICVITLHLSLQCQLTLEVDSSTDMLCSGNCDTYGDRFICWWF